MSTGGEDTVLASPRSATESWGGRLKFLCSCGGRILPRPSDGHLKYVGGDTRVVSVPRNTTFSELMKKLTALFEAEVVLKYQLFSEDLDALVSVTCDEDLQNMIDEYDRLQTLSHNVSPYPSSSGGGPARFRAFLFPANPLLPDSSVTVPRDCLEQRYIDAINGVRTPRHHHHHFAHHPHHQRTPSSNESSPRSVVTERPGTNNSQNEVASFACGTLQRVLSSPNLFCSCGTAHPSRLCCGGQRAGKAPAGRAAVPAVAKTMQRNGSGRFYSPVQRRSGPGEEGCHRREGSGGCGISDGEWRL